MQTLLLGLLGVVMCAGYPRLQFDGGGRQDLLQNDNNNNGGVDTKYSLRNLVDHQVLKKDSLYDKHKAFNEENHQVSTFSELTKSLQFSGELTDNLGFHSSSSGKNLEVLGVDHDGDHLRSRRSIIGNNEVNYLSKFGYLPQSILETGALTTDHQLKNAIRSRFQAAGLSRRYKVLFVFILFPIPRSDQIRFFPPLFLFPSPVLWKKYIIYFEHPPFDQSFKAEYIPDYN